jgi:JmjC domain, hydroxylase
MTNHDAISRHTRGLRRALQYCRQGASSLDQWPCAGEEIVPKQEFNKRLTGLRQQAQVAFWKRQQSLSDCDACSLDTIRVVSIEEGDEADTTEFSSIWDYPNLDQPRHVRMSLASSRALFRKCYEIPNIPCKIVVEKDHGNVSDWFHPAVAHWCTTEKQSDPAESTNARQRNHRSIKTDWFEKYLGHDDITLPVRQEPACIPVPSNDALDEAGRATECQQVPMSLAQWTALLKRDRHDTDAPRRYYLKDWHLTAWLQMHHPDQLPLYRTPSVFPHDLLNSFLLQFHDDGAAECPDHVQDSLRSDYQFVYWGPTGSRTLVHSDVLHSFSWSYNVCGTKEWIFFKPPASAQSTETDRTSTCRVIQQAGEIIFVPAGWVHQVTNLEETLSINHNWITSANLDMVWSCLHLELQAVDEELSKWPDYSATDPSWRESRENMLRGCAGIDVSTFFLMVLGRLVDILGMFVEMSPEGAASFWKGNNKPHFSTLFDFHSLAAVLESVLVSNAEINDRLEATLGDRGLSCAAMDLAARTLTTSRFVISEYHDGLLD